MQKLNRRQFFGVTSSVAAAVPALAAAAADTTGESAAIDFRYAPLSGQTAFCLADDPYKSLIGERGELRGDHGTISFSLGGMEPDVVGDQRLDSPAAAIVHTRIERPEAWLELTTFATNRPSEGRVDNVILEVRPRTAHRVYAAPHIVLRLDRETVARGNEIHFRDTSAPFLIASAPLSGQDACRLPEGPATVDEPLRYFVRLPQQGQPADRLAAGLAEPGALLAEARAYWRELKLFGSDVSWSLPHRHGEFLTACARNILQAREMKDGRLTFQVGPTVYRGLWVVDGHFILEAARYLGYDAEAQSGLETTWARQRPDGGIFAGAGTEHWKDTGIAIFTLVRQCELAQNVEHFRKMRPEVLRAVSFLKQLRDKARAEPSANGRYGLLPRGMGDGGLGGIRSELTNTLWAVAGLKAAAAYAAQHRLDGFEPVDQLYGELNSALFGAMRQEMRRHPAGFDYLPMLMREDPQWSAAGERERPRPQTAQWALSHAIYPGLVFSPGDPIVAGHISLMQAATQEDVPAETGWIPHEGLWTYNAAFVAHAYLWAGLPDWARLTFHGFLNHATRLYCWREEQPLRGSLTAGYVGDMPHNWASAECILYLRHMLALEDGRALRLLAGVGGMDLSTGDPRSLSGTPTRFGRINLTLEPAAAGRWTVRFQRGRGPAPVTVELPATLGGLQFSDVKGSSATKEARRVLLDPSAGSWVATYA